MTIAAIPSSGQVGIALFPILMIWAGAADVMTLRISNRLVAVMASLFFPLAFASGMPGLAMAVHLATGLALLCLGFALFSFRVIGGGDAKLLAAAGLWLGFPSVLPFLLFSALAGGVLAAAIGLWSAMTVEAGFRSPAVSDAMDRMRPSLPYGFALAAGAILAVPFSWWMAAATVPT